LTRTDARRLGQRGRLPYPVTPFTAYLAGCGDEETRSPRYCSTLSRFPATRLHLGDRRRRQDAVPRRHEEPPRYPAGRDCQTRAPASGCYSCPPSRKGNMPSRGHRGTAKLPQQTTVETVRAALRASPAHSPIVDSFDGSRAPEFLSRTHTGAQRRVFTRGIGGLDSPKGAICFRLRR
jgi:hypothetical protein